MQAYILTLLTPIPVGTPNIACFFIYVKKGKTFGKFFHVVNFSVAFSRELNIKQYLSNIKWAFKISSNDTIKIFSRVCRVNWLLHHHLNIDFAVNVRKTGNGNGNSNILMIRDLRAFFIDGWTKTNSYAGGRIQKKKTTMKLGLCVAVSVFLINYNF